MRATCQQYSPGRASLPPTTRPCRNPDVREVVESSFRSDKRALLRSRFVPFTPQTNLLLGKGLGTAGRGPVDPGC